MKYLSIKSVVDAYNGFQDSMTNKSWGYLSLLKSCNKGIKPSVSYKIHLDEISNFLENIFNLSQIKKKYNGDRSLFVVFSNKWDTYFKEQGLKVPNIFDVAVWAYRRETFPDNFSNEDLLNKFANEFNIPLSIINNSFNTDHKNILFSNSLYSEDSLKKELSLIGVNVTSDNIDAKKSKVVAYPGEISRGPFIQTLYAGLEITDYVLILQSNFLALYGKNEILESSDLFNRSKYAPLQQILFGAPGTGKSHTLKNDANITEKNSIRTTFHPDSDYSTFVGCYKPTKDEERGEITYDFTPQAFTNAYIAAWKDLENPFFLIIEEINRGNCAQVFGDIFQLLDRDEYGYSSYKTTPDQDLANYIRKQLDDADIDDAEVKSGKKMQLPPNLHIWATMNTSDQSLFPIDSAFKRRWDWRYIPIDYTDRGHYIACGDTQYSWADFLQKVNERVESVTMSEDKKLGYWFTGNGLGQKEITIDRFVSKVVFYLWNDVFKDFGRSGNTIFKDSFSKFHLFFDFSGKPKIDIVKAFLDALEVKKQTIESETEQSESEQDNNI